MVAYSFKPRFVSPIQAAYRAAAAKVHPDKGGSHEAMAEVNDARTRGLADAP